MGDRERVVRSQKWVRQRARRVGALVLLVVGAACTAPSGTSPSPASHASETEDGPPPDGRSATPSGFAVLARGAQPLARPELEIGRLDPDKRIENLSLVFKLSPEQLADRDALVPALTLRG